MNNTVLPATGFTPNYLTSGREIDLGQQPVITRGGDLVENGREAANIVKENLEKNRERMERHRNRLRNQGVTVEVQDWVMLESEGIVLPGHSVLSAKNRPKYVGPFKVVEGDNHENFKLDLPPSLSKLHPWFSVQKLKVYLSAESKDLTVGEALSRKDFGGVTADGPDPSQDREPGTGTDNSDHVIDHIVTHRLKRDRKSWMFLVKWHV